MLDRPAREIAETVGGDLMIVGVLKGSFVFVAGLIRVLDRQGLAPRVEFAATAPTGKVPARWA